MQNAIVQAMLSSLGSMLRSFGYDDKYLGGILEGIAKDTHDMAEFIQAVARENSERLARMERKIDTLLPFPIVDHEKEEKLNEQLVYWPGKPPVAEDLDTPT